MKHDNYSATLDATAASSVVIDSRKVFDEEIAKATSLKPLLWRANGNSIHDQALTTGHLALLRTLPHAIRVSPSDVISRDAAGADVTWATARVTAWTPWEVVVRASLRIADVPEKWDGTWDLDATGAQSPKPDTCAWTEAHANRRYLPYVVPSSGRITVGGSLSADTMWRFSTMFGHQARSVVWVDLLAYEKDAQGKRVTYVLRLLNPDGGMWAHRNTLHQDPAPNAVRFAEQADGKSDTNDLYFRGVIGGFGMLGPILGAKLMLLEIGDVKSPTFPVKPFPDTTPPPPPMPFPSPSSTSPTAPPAPRWPLPHERLAPPIERDHHPIDPEGHPDETLRRQMRGQLPFIDSTPISSSSPGYPHTASSELGTIGNDLDQQALTWMWVTDDPEAVFDDLLEHHKKHAEKPLVDGFALPRAVDPDGWTRFGLFFPCREDRLVTAVGSVAFGRPAGNPEPFKMWNRSYANDNLGLVLKALPWAAGLGEDIVYHTMFKPTMEDTANHEVRANSIAEFALFMEGHSAYTAKHGKTKTVQQTWVLPLPADVSTWSDPTKTKASKSLFVRFLKAVRKISTQGHNFFDGKDGAIRIQVCDVKVLPRGTTLLASTNESPCIAVTVAIEDGADLTKMGWGDPDTKLTQLCADFLADDAKIHLTKNHYAPKGQLPKMYAAQIVEFKKVKTALDPDAIYGSAMSTRLGI